MRRFEEGDEVRIDIPDRTDPDHQRYRGETGEITDIVEDDATRLEINLQRTEDRDTGELTENYALYLSVAERG